MLLVLLLLLVYGAASEPIQAAPSVRFTNLGAAVDFPDRIVFTLDASADVPVQRLELRYRPVLGQVTFVARPPFVPGTVVSVRYERDMRLNYLPPGIEIAYFWRLGLADGRWVDSPVRVFSYVDTRYRWVYRAEWPVEIYSAVEDQRYVAAANEVTRSAVEAFTRRFAVSLDGPLRVVLYPSPEALRGALPLQSEEWIGGVAIPEYRLVLAGIAPGIGARAELERILSHEVLHLVIAQATDNPFAAPPAWLDEGLATLYQTAEDPRLEAALERARRTGTLPSVRALGGGFGTDPEQALVGYAASRSIMEFIQVTYGDEGVRRLLAAYREGVTDDQALERSLGLTVDELDRAWKAWLATRAAGSNPSPSLVPVTVVLLAGLVLLARRRRAS